MAISEQYDLPERFGPMTVKELRQSLRRTSFVYPFICIHIFATIAIYAEFQHNISSGSGIPAVLAWDPEKVGPFWWVVMTVCGIAAGSIAASGFTTLAAKLGVFVLYMFSAFGGGGAGMIGGSMALVMNTTSKWSWLGNTFYHFSVMVVVLCYCVIGLLVARSRLRLAMMNFELKPSSVLLIIIGLAPFIVGMIAIFTCGFGSIAGVLLLTYLAWNSDRTPKTAKWIAPPPPNIPPPVVTDVGILETPHQSLPPDPVPRGGGGCHRTF